MNLTDRDRRRATLRHLAGQVDQFRAALDGVRNAMRELMDTSEQRRLTSDEAARVRRLRWESEGLRCELSLLREQFEELRSA